MDIMQLEIGGVKVLIPHNSIAWMMVDPSPQGGEFITTVDGYEHHVPAGTIDRFLEQRPKCIRPRCIDSSRGVDSRIDFSRVRSKELRGF
jgi:hypothetical protein